jgi:hypothetical protein
MTHGASYRVYVQAKRQEKSTRSKFDSYKQKIYLSWIDSSPKHRSSEKGREPRQPGQSCQMRKVNDARVVAYNLPDMATC